DLSNPNVLTCSTCKAMDEISKTGSLQFNFLTIRIATDNFSDANKLGKGGFGFVYKVINIINKSNFILKFVC
ncbi:hypothetical protein RGQ29_019221, partial [Quercus rubra]